MCRSIFAVVMMVAVAFVMVGCGKEEPLTSPVTPETVTAPEGSEMKPMEDLQEKALESLEGVQEEAQEGLEALEEITQEGSEVLEEEAQEGLEALEEEAQKASGMKIMEGSEMKPMEGSEAK